jgi:hypothetical protein
MPVNADGTGWHQSHAFGDFCYICHAGNNQAKEKAAAHEGMVAPLADVKAACQQCHVADLDARAKVYADKLGVEVGSAAPVSASGGDSAAAPIAAAPAASSSTCNEVVVDDPNAVDYVANYNEIVLGKTTTNWGNMILMGMIGLMLVGGGGFVVTREKFINVKFGDTKAVDNEYPADVVAMLPKLANLKSGARQSLNNVLESKKAEKVLGLIDEVVKKDEE